MRPLFGPVGMALVFIKLACAVTGSSMAGGASVAVMFGLDSYGDGGAFWLDCKGLGVVDELGSLTVAVSFGEADWREASFCSVVVVVVVVVIAGVGILGVFDIPSTDCDGTC